VCRKCARKCAGKSVVARVQVAKTQLLHPGACRQNAVACLVDSSPKRSCAAGELVAKTQFATLRACRQNAVPQPVS
jgi:hypothetical protein